MKFAILLLTIVFFSCAKDDANNVSATNLEGKWIESETRLDTLNFELLDNLKLMTLNRGKEIRNGILLLKLASGPYEYKLEKDKIALKWIPSSNYNFKDYYFKSSENRLTIGNFYGLGLAETLTFEKFE